MLVPSTQILLLVHQTVDQMPPSSHKQLASNHSWCIHSLAVLRDGGSREEVGEEEKMECWLSSRQTATVAVVVRAVVTAHKRPLPRIPATSHCAWLFKWVPGFELGPLHLTSEHSHSLSHAPWPCILTLFTNPEAHHFV